MAKIALSFIVVFCFVQLCLSTPFVKRDTKDAEENSLAKTLEAEFNKIKTQIEQQLTEENLNKLSAQLSEFGEKLKEGAKGVLTKLEQNEQAKPSS